MIRLAVRVRSEQAELVLAELLELAPGGVEESCVDEQTIEYAVYGARGELPSLPDLTAASGDALVEITTSETADDWPERWKRFHRPVLIAPPRQPDGETSSLPTLRVRPPWEAVADETAGARIEEIVIDPGQAFGTGGHASTRLCLELLLEIAALERSGASTRGALLDLGTGSGVLAIAAARLGFTPVLAVDNERESVAAARANAAVNDVELEVRRFDLRSDPFVWPRSDGPAGERQTIVLANLLSPLLLELASALPVPPAHLVASGLLLDQVDEVASAFAARSLTERERRHSGEWAALWLSSG